MYRLKADQPDFEVVDGPFAGRHYRAGETYTEIPPQETHRFDPLDSMDPTDSTDSIDPIDSTDPFGGE